MLITLAVVAITTLVSLPMIASHVLPGGMWAETFESYTCSAFPSPTWTLRYNGAGNAFQYVDCTNAKYGSKSLHLKGQMSWSAQANRDIPDFSSPVIGLSAWVKTGTLTSDTNTAAHVSFYWKPTSSYAWGVHMGVSFNGDGKIVWDGTGTLLGTYTGNTWHQVQIIINKLSNNYAGKAAVFLDGE